MLEFVVLITVVVAYLLYKTIRYYGITWVKTREGKGVLFGLLAAPVVAIVIALLLSLISGCSYIKDPYVEVYAGVERTKNLSPQCERGGADDKLTSNLGVNLCTTASKDGKTTACVVYRHHSCAITEDDRSYDAFGFQVSRRAYIR